MKAFLLYMTESAFAMSILLLFYRYLYFKMAYFEWSRIFLILSAVVSLVMPLIPIPSAMQGAEEGLHLILQDAYVLQYSQSSEWISERTLTFILYGLFSVWLAGAVIRLIIFLKSLSRTLRMVSKDITAFEDGFRLHNISSISSLSFSFFRHVFLGSDYYDTSPEDRKYIIRHEKAHGRLLHSIDRLFFELYRIAFWFNPFTKLLILSIKEIHEFSADNNVTDNRFSERYSLLLVRMASDSLIFPAASKFSQKEQLKHRLQLIANPESDRIRKRRFNVSLPVLFITLFAVQFVFLSINAELLPGKGIHAPIHTSDWHAKIPYFKKLKAEELNKPAGHAMHIELSHPQTDYKTNGPADIFAGLPGKVIEIDTVDYQGLPEIRIAIENEKGYTLIYEKLAETNIQSGDIVKMGDKIGRTGDSSLYPVFTFKVRKDGRYVNPDKIKP